MKVIAKSNFKANGVKAKPGDVLTQEQIEQIESLLDSMEKQNLISIEKDAAPAEPEPQFEGIIDEGPGRDDMPGDDIGTEEAPVSEEKPKKKKKK